MKTVAVMQPYFFPYIGYWQLIEAVDIFVIFDNVDFIVRGYVNRNEILLQGRRHRITLPVKKASQNKKIVSIERAEGVEKIVETVAHAYAKAPYFEENFGWLKERLTNPETNLAKYLGENLRDLSARLGCATQFCYAGDIQGESDLKGEEKIIDLCRRLSATRYINPIGGKALYDKERFAREGVALHFLEPLIVPYRQRSDGFVPSLSIIDVLMYNGMTKTRSMLQGYRTL